MTLQQDQTRVALIVANEGVEQVELTEPWKALEAGKPVAVICHGPWLLVEADVLRGRKLTSWPTLQTDIRNAGGEWVDEQVCVDAGLVTSRKPDDLPAFCEALIAEVAKDPHDDRAVEAGSSPGRA